jgi:hypothetical protein
MAIVTRRITYAWRNFSEKYTVNCQECGRPLTRSVSSGCNELADAEYIRALQNRLQKQADEASKNPITCNACLKGKIRPIDSFIPVPEEEIEEITHLCAALAEARNNVSAFARQLHEQYKDRIAFYKDKEWKIDDISLGYEGQVTAYCYRINKRQPWLLTDERESIVLSDLRLSDEMFKDRKAACSWVTRSYDETAQDLEK